MVDDLRLICSFTRCTISIKCAEGFTPPANAIPPDPAELKAFKSDGLLAVKSLTLSSRIGLGVAKAVLSKGPRLDSMHLMDLTATDVLVLLGQMSTSGVPRELTLESLRPGDGQHANIRLLAIKEKLQKVKVLIVKEEAASRLAAVMRPHMPSLETFVIGGSETEVRQALIGGGHGGFSTLTFGLMSEDRREFVKAENEREGITLGDHKDQMPHINSLVIHLDVPYSDAVEPGTFLLSSIWSLLEIQSINSLTIVLPDSPDVSSHLDALNMATERRFGPDLVFWTWKEVESRLVLTASDIKRMQGAAFAYSRSTTGPPFPSLTASQSQQPPLATFQNMTRMPDRYLSSLSPDVSAGMLVRDFAGRMRAAAPMSGIDPPYAPERLKASLLSEMERHGMVMEPMMRLHGDGPCIPSPSVTVSVSQLMAILQKTGKHITGVELLYKGTVHGFAYTDMLNRVGDASCLVFLIRSDASIHGCFIDTSLHPAPELPVGARPPSLVVCDGHSNRNSSDGLIFKTTGGAQITFQSCFPSGPFFRDLALRRMALDHYGKMTVRDLDANGCMVLLGLWAPDSAGTPGEGLCVVRVMWEPTNKLIRADEVEVLRLVVQTGD
ncbi:unnamed protein product [Vitrella brassicaformis CCMP3155]|uniref:TLDc domain-containing protein n=2 Tax=Vitrella brassicaformis TaxID=1169539 RepID=A0A0G4EWE5_VITBC|nr:unnamed protein product [Vitrella brassicaformis CCMP3155]|eukprot:CEM02363.1 unnamed protein product [Vitrella brassicaformis CCMP3155]